MSEEKVEEGIKKFDDWWAEHNFSTRFSIIVFILMFIIVALYPFLAPAKEVMVDGVKTLVSRDIKHYDLILKTVTDTAFWAFAAVTIGPNTLVKLADAWAKVKSVKK